MDVFTDVEASLKDIRELLEEDELLEQKLQEALGQAGASLAGSKAELAEVRRDWAKYMGVHEKASFTNSELHRAMNLHVGNLRLLSGPLDQVRAALPTPALTPGEPHALPPPPTAFQLSPHIRAINKLWGFAFGDLVSKPSSVF